MVVFANFVSVIFDYFSGSFLAAKVRVKFQVYIRVYAFKVCFQVEL